VRPLEDEGNAYTRDLLYDKATNKQFITVTTKNGNTFYIVIDYDAPINDEEEQYRELTPTLEYIRKEQKQEKPSIRDQLKGAARTQPEKKAPAKAKKHEMGLE
jgi:hypothetical protein